MCHVLLCHVFMSLKYVSQKKSCDLFRTHCIQTPPSNTNIKLTATHWLSSPPPPTPPSPFPPPPPPPPPAHGAVLWVGWVGCLNTAGKICAKVAWRRKSLEELELEKKEKLEEELEEENEKEK